MVLDDVPTPTDLKVTASSGTCARRRTWQFAAPLPHNEPVWPPRWSRRKSVKILIPVGGAVLLGRVGWLLGPLWAVAGIPVGAVAALSLLVIMFARGRPDPERLMQARRPLQAYRLLQYEISFIRGQARWRPALNAGLADRLETLCQALQALGNEPRPWRPLPRPCPAIKASEL